MFCAFFNIVRTKKGNDENKSLFFEDISKGGARAAGRKDKQKRASSIEYIEYESVLFRTIRFFR